MTKSGLSDRIGLPNLAVATRGTPGVPPRGPAVCVPRVLHRLNTGRSNFLASTPGLGWSRERETMRERKRERDRERSRSNDHCTMRNACVLLPVRTHTFYSHVRFASSGAARHQSTNTSSSGGPFEDIRISIRRSRGGSISSDKAGKKAARKSLLDDPHSRSFFFADQELMISSR